MKKYLTLLAVTVLSIALIVGTATAATEAEKQAAIDAGLAYLAAQQNADGSITSPWSYTLTATAAAVLAFAEEGSTISGGPYQAVVQNAMNYIFSRASSQAITVQTNGDPDTNGNGLGVYFQSNGLPTYEVGLAIPAIIKAGSPSATVATGPLAGQTYAAVVRDTVDWIAWAQNENVGVYDGGWRYSGNYGDSDNSVSQWPVIAMLYANQWTGNTAPSFVNTELEKWVTYIQNPVDGDLNDGGSGYTGPDVWVNEAKTGGLLLQMSYLGYPLSDPAVQAALAYIENGWGELYDDGTFASAYAMWGIYKGLELTVGLDDTAFAAGNYFYDPLTVTLDPGDNYTWWEDYCEYLVNTQDTSGYWTNIGGWADPAFGTAWYINILAATEIPGPEPQVPEPATMLLLGLGLLGVGVFRRKT